jgi:hypothetical protein
MSRSFIACRSTDLIVHEPGDLPWRRSRLHLRENRQARFVYGQGHAVPECVVNADL